MLIPIGYLIITILSCIALILAYTSQKKEIKILKESNFEFSNENVNLRREINRYHDTRNQEDYYRNQLNKANEKIKEFERLLPKHNYTVCFENEYENNEGDYIFETIEANYPVVSEDGSTVCFKLDGRVIALFNNVKYWKEEV